MDRAVITALQKFLILLIGACSNTLGLIPLSLDFRPPSSLENPALSLGLTRLSSCRQDYGNLPMRPTLQGCSQGKSLQVPGKLPQGRPRASPGVPWRPLISHSRTLNGPCTPAQRKDSKNWTLAHGYRPSRAWESFICKNKEQQQRDWETQLGVGVGAGASSNAKGEYSALSPARSPGSLRGCGQPGETLSHLAQKKRHR